MALLRGWKEGDVPKGIKCLVGGGHYFIQSSGTGTKYNFAHFIYENTKKC